MCLWKSVHVLFVAGQWKQCCDGLMKIDTLNSRKAITVKQGSLYHEIGNVTEDALPDLISSFPRLHAQLIILQKHGICVILGPSILFLSCVFQTISRPEYLARVVWSEPCDVLSFSVGFERSPHLLQVFSESYEILFCCRAPETLRGLQNLPQLSIIVGTRREQLNFYIFAWISPLNLHCDWCKFYESAFCFIFHAGNKRQ